MDCEAHEGHFAAADDCDDGLGAVNPDAAEICDGLDNDCDGLVDPATSDGAPTWYADSDGDGFGDAGSPLIACESPSGHVAEATDCDDAAPDTNPDGQEVCGGGDEDCDGLLDDEDGSVDLSTGDSAFIDADGDGFGAAPVVACVLPPNAVSDDTDCDDADPSNYPSAAERCDGVDNDCDGDDDTIGYWPLDEGTGSTVYDAAVLGRRSAGTSGTRTTGSWVQASWYKGRSTDITMTTSRPPSMAAPTANLGLGAAASALTAACARFGTVDTLLSMAVPTLLSICETLIDAVTSAVGGGSRGDRRAGVLESWGASRQPRYDRTP